MSVISGRVWDGDDFCDGYVIVEDGIVAETGYGDPPETPDMKGCVVPGIIDCHTHIADAGLKLGRRYGLEELVAPPNGLKHRYLKDTPVEKITADMKRYSSELVSGGVSKFIDFRENGAAGCRALRKASENSIILGRPVSPEFDPNEIDDILSVADGIGIPSISDMDSRYIDSVADAVHRKKKMLAIHVSERIREDIDTVMSLSPDFVVHMVTATDGDMRRCRDDDIPIVVCARSNVYFGLVPPLRRMHDIGARIAIGTDNAMLAPPDIFGEARVFADIMKEQGLDRSLTFGSLFKEGKKILYEGSAIGVRAGEKADITVLQCRENEILSGIEHESVRYGP